MSKEPKDYTPSPWLREEHEKSKVRIPPAMVGALYQLQKDDKEVEYGGAIDFELVKGAPAVERVLTYTGAVKEVPGDVWQKVFSNPDIELTFHTHPKQEVAIPSDGDIVFFLTTEPRAMLIIAGKEAIFVTKGANTPPPDYSRKYMESTQMKSIEAISGLHGERGGYRDPKSVQQDAILELKRILDIDSMVFPAKHPIEITVNIVQEIAREGKHLDLFK